MKQWHTLVLGTCVLTALYLQAQQPKVAADSAAVSAQDARVTIPRLIRFAGAISSPSGSSLAGTLQITFTLYRQEFDESPLWTEMQAVQVDEQGRYSVLLGATQAEGLPAELFSSSEAHWLGLEIQGQLQQPRTLLVSVPYALKAVDAEMLSGKSLSDFVLAENLSQQVGRIIDSQSQPQPTSNSAQTKIANSATTNATMSPNRFPPRLFAGCASSKLCGLVK